MNTYKAAVLGATGMVGQRFISLLENHPWFTVVAVAASPRSAGKPYTEAVDGRWAMSTPVPTAVAPLTVLAVEADLAAIAAEVDVVFCALDMEKDDIRRIEDAYAAAGVAVISNNSAHRWTADVPMIMPEVNPDHAALIDTQRKNHGWDTGLVAVKPNCSIQSYVSVLTALKAFEPTDVAVTSLQAISGAGKTFETWPEMVDNVIPLIGGEEEKSEKEPMKIWGEALRRRGDARNHAGHYCHLHSRPRQRWAHGISHGTVCRYAVQRRHIGSNCYIPKSTGRAWPPLCPQAAHTLF
jgi:aspartate-semialdehyde dehydrogenase